MITFCANIDLDVERLIQQIGCGSSGAPCNDPARAAAAECSNLVPAM
jgi:hypothetical protein